MNIIISVTNGMRVYRPPPPQNVQADLQAGEQTHQLGARNVSSFLSSRQPAHLLQGQGWVIHTSVLSSSHQPHTSVRLCPVSVCKFPLTPPTLSCYSPWQMCLRDSWSAVAPSRHVQILLKDCSSQSLTAERDSCTFGIIPWKDHGMSFEGLV